MSQFTKRSNNINFQRTEYLLSQLNTQKAPILTSNKNVF